MGNERQAGMQLPKMTRMFEATFTRVEPAAEGEQATYEVAISSEAEVERTDFWTGDRWVEVLGHGRHEVDMTRLRSGAAVLVDHGGDQIGVVENARLDDDKVLRGSLRFSRSTRGQEVEQDVRDGIRRSISVGYFIERLKPVGERDGAVKVLRATRWQPAEVSLVSVPADVTVGVGRSSSSNVVVTGTGTDSSSTGTWPGTWSGGWQTHTVPMPMFPVIVEAGGDDAQEERDMAADKATVDVTAEAQPKQPETAEQRAKAIAEVAEANGMAERAADLIASPLATQEAINRLLEAVKTRGKGQPSAESLVEMGLPAKDARKYSYARAVLLAAGDERGGLEAEVDSELAGRWAGLPRRGGFCVPLARGTRTLTSNVATKGPELVFEAQGEFIELLRNATAVVRLGARTLTGLGAPVTFPKQTGAMTASWVGEGGAVTNTDVAFGIAQLVPKQLMASTAFSRALLVQAGPDVENIVNNDFAAVTAIAWDYAAVHGLGAAGEPTGLYAALNVGSSSIGGAMSYAKVLEMEGKVATANALLGTLGWLMNPTMSANLKAVVKVASTYSPVWEGPITEGNVDGYRAIATAQVSKAMTGSARTGGSEIGAIFGNWSDLIIGQFGPGMELVVDPYSQKKSGLIEVTSFMLCDVLTRHGESFAKATGATA